MHRMLLAVLVAVALGGCIGDGAPAALPPTTQDVPEETGLAIVGVVQTEDFTPLQGATVALSGGPADLESNTTTDADGRFRFAALEAGTYLVHVALTGFENATLRASLVDEDAALDVQLRRSDVVEAYEERVHFSGIMTCAAEYLIISGGCDAPLTYAGQDPVFDGNNTFEFDLQAGWRTLVVDVVFDGAAQPGLDGLRTAVSGARADREVQDYEQYGRFHAPESYTFRIEPNGTYPEGVAPVPDGQTTMRLEVLPHSHGWHAVCVPPDDGTCFLGIGAGTDVTFDLYATAFYGEPAPEGFSLR